MVEPLCQFNIETNILTSIYTLLILSCIYHANNITIKNQYKSLDKVDGHFSQSQPHYSLARFFIFIDILVSGIQLQGLFCVNVTSFETLILFKLHCFPYYL